MNTPQTIEEATIVELKSQLDAAQKACAEMRRALELSIGFYSRFQFLLRRLYRTLPHPISWPNEDMTVVHWVEDALSLKRPTEIHHALSSDCGKDYVPRAELDKLKERVKPLVECLKHVFGHFADKDIFEMCVRHPGAAAGEYSVADAREGFEALALAKSLGL